jgi:hypothetical protein
LEIAVLLFVVLVGGYFISKSQTNTHQVLTSTQAHATSQVAKPTDDTSEIHSPDMKHSLVLKTKAGGEGTKTYTFSVTDRDGANRHDVFVKTLASGSSMAMPFNSWSVDGKYLFLSETDEGKTSFYVFKADGSKFANEEQFLNINELFAARGLNFTFGEATGWASETLIVFSTTNLDGTKGPNYWFEVPSKAFIQLAR